MPQIIDDMPMPTIPGTNEPDYPIYLPPMPSRPMPSRPIKPGGRPLPGTKPFMPSFDKARSRAEAQERAEAQANIARQQAIMTALASNKPAKGSNTPAPIARPKVK
jgi:hypothetical protein